MTSTAKVYLSVRNVQTLLNKLARAEAGELTACTLIKHDNTHPVYPQTMALCGVRADPVDQTYYYCGPDGDGVCLSKATLEQMLETHCTVTVTGEWPGIAIDVAVIPDTEYYIHRGAGQVHPSDDPGMRQ